MKKFIGKNIVFLLILLVVTMFVCVYMHIYLSTHTNNYMLETHHMNFPHSIEKLKKKESPSIIIIGGSGCGQGFLSEELAKHYNMPVINTGTHAGYGLCIMLHMVEPYINKGDVILLIPEYAHFNRLTYWGEKYALFALYGNHENILERLNILQIIYLLQFYPQYIQETWVRENYIPMLEMDDATKNHPYSVFSLNQYGDVTCYEKRKHLDEIEILRRLSKINKYAMKETKYFIKDFESKGAKCILLPPAYRDIQYDIDKEHIEKIATMFEKLGMPYLAKPDRYRIPDTMCFDTPYHLTYEGCAYRTQLVIEDIDRILKKE